METKAELRENLYYILKDFDTTMLSTHSAGGDIHARPMAVAQLSADADAYFVTSLDAAKISELGENSLVTLTFQSSTQFASVTGNGTVIRDQGLIDRLWNEGWAVWFPKGKNDPSVTLIKFEAREGEYWNNAGAEGVRYFFNAVKAYATGETPTVDDTIHAKVTL
jgi:general stress protein 26